MDIIHPAAQGYAEKYSREEDQLLRQVADETISSHQHAHMLSGYLQGKFLQIFSKVLQPRYVLEIGTFTGYSALCLVQGIQPDGQLHTIEMREEDAQKAKGYFNRSAYKDSIVLHQGNAKDIIPQLAYDWDLVFLDADKTGYLDYYKLLMPVLKSGAVLLADNVLFHGQVLESVVTGKNAKAIQAFNDYVVADESVETVMLTVRDGLMLIRKK